MRPAHYLGRKAVVIKEVREGGSPLRRMLECPYCEDEFWAEQSELREDGAYCKCGVLVFDNCRAYPAEDLK